MPASCCLTQFLPVRQGALPPLPRFVCTRSTTVFSVCRSVIPQNKCGGGILRNAAATSVS